MNGHEAPRDAATPHRVLDRLGSLSFALQSAAGPDALFHALVDHVLDIASADQFALLLLNEESGDLEGYAYERDRAGARRLLLLPDSGGFLGQVLRRESFYLQEPSGSATALRDEIGWSGDPPATLVGMPLRIGTTLLGLTVIGYRCPRTVTNRRRRTLLFLTDQIGLAVDRLRIRAELHASAHHLDEARLALRRLDQAKSDLISIVSHEMRTPLTAIKAYTESLIDNLGSPSFEMQERFLHVINEESDRLTRMVNDVLDLSRMDSGRHRLHAEPLGVAAVVADALPTVEPALQQKRLRVQVNVPGDLPRVEADFDLLKQVFVNLLHNAAKFSPEGREITVHAESLGDRVRFDVADQGDGIPSEDLPHVFERFYRVEGGAGPRAGGTGLGLAIVKRVIELHGGTIHAESEVGRGTRFIVELPFHQRGFLTLIRSLEPLFVQPERRRVLQQCVTMVAEVMEARIVSFMFLDETGTHLRIQAAHGLDRDTVARTLVRVGDSIAGWVAHHGEPLLVRDIESSRRFGKMSHPQYETKSLVAAPIAIAGVTVGVMNVNNKSDGLPFDDDDLRLLVAIAARVSMALERLHDQPTESDIAATLSSLRAVIRARRQRLLPSTRRSLNLVTEVGRRLALPEDEIEILGYVSRVHDVGMLAVDEARRGSSRVWGEQERREVEGHPQSSVRLLRPLESAPRVHEIILAHHERMDGTGYPRGLRGEEIPLAARILAAIDAFESLTTGRPYRDPVSDADALTELRRASGTQFDPAVVEALAAALRDLDSARRDPAGTTPPTGTTKGVTP